MRRNSRPPYALAPMLILLVGILYWAINSGFKLTGSPFGLHGERPADRAAMNEHIAAGIDAQKHGDSRGAADDFLQAAGDAGDGSHAYVDVARELIGQDLFPAATNLLVPKTQDFGWDPMFWATLADAYTQADDMSKANDAIKHAQQAALALEGEQNAKLPAPADAHASAARLLELGRYYRESRDADGPKAIAALRAALARTPNDPAVLSALGFTLADRGTTPKEWAEAVTLTQKAVQSATDGGYPADSHFLDAYGWALLRSGDATGAQRALATALDVDPDDAVLHFHMAKVYLALNDLPGAGIELDRALLFRTRYPEADAARKALPSPLPQPTPIATPKPDSLPTPSPSATPTPAASPSASPSPSTVASPTPAASPSATPLVVRVPIPVNRSGMPSATPSPSAGPVVKAK